jgi:hypothetical protein
MEGPTLAEIEAKNRKEGIDALIQRKAEIEKRLAENERNFTNKYGGTETNPYPQQQYQMDEYDAQPPHQPTELAHEDMLKANEEASKKEYLERMYSLQGQELAMQQKREEEADHYNERQPPSYPSVQE